MPRFRVWGGAVLVVVTLAATAGCSSGSTATVSQTSDETAEASGTLTPLEKGEVHHEMLAVAEASIAAFLADDPAAIEEAYSDVYVDLFADEREEYASEGKVRVRQHDDTWVDIVEMNESGTQSLAQYKFTENSYFASESGEQLTEPEAVATEWQLTIDGSPDDGFIVTRVIGRAATLE
jgi:hypothetical protein